MAQMKGVAQPVAMKKPKAQAVAVKKPSFQSVVGKSPKKWIVALLLSILVGSLGVDRFYMGYIGTGILKLVTFGGFGIWWLIDLILIATKHDFAKVQWVE